MLQCFALGTLSSAQSMDANDASLRNLEHGKIFKHFTYLSIHKFVLILRWYYQK